MSGLRDNSEGPGGENRGLMVNKWKRQAHELLAILLAVKTSAKSQQNGTILLKTDNIPTRAYISYTMGNSLTPHEAVKLWKWCIERQIFVIADYEE